MAATFTNRAEKGACLTFPMQQIYFWNPNPVCFLQVGTLISPPRSLAQIGPAWRHFVAQTLLLFGKDVQRGAPCVANPPRFAGGPIKASTCGSLIIEPKGSLCNTSGFVRISACLFSSLTISSLQLPERRLECGGD